MTRTAQHTDTLTFCTTQDNFSRDIRKKQRSIQSWTGCQLRASVIKLHMHTVAQAAAQLNWAAARRVTAAAWHERKITEFKKGGCSQKQEGGTQDDRGGIKKVIVWQRQKGKPISRCYSKNKTRVENTSGAVELVPSLTHSSVNIFAREVQ